MLLESDASGSEFMDFQYISNRKVLFLKSHSSALELFQLQCSSDRKALILDSHASQPLNWLFFNAILKDRQSRLRLTINYFSMQFSKHSNDSGQSHVRCSIDWFWIQSDRKTLILNSHASRLELTYSHWILKENQCFWTVTPQAQNSFILKQFLKKSIDSAQSCLKIRIDLLSLNS